MFTFYQMPRGKKLSDYEKGQIDALNANGKTNREIARFLGRSHDVVDRFLRNPKGYGMNKSPGRPNKLSKRDKRNISRAASNSTSSCNKIRKDLKLNVTPETVRLALKNNCNIVRQKMKVAPALSVKHKRKRLEFARLSMTRDWTKVRYFVIKANQYQITTFIFQVIWSDEKKFNLDGPDGSPYYWHDLRKETIFFPRRTRGGKSVMVWGSFCSTGKPELAFVQHNLDSVRYQELLQSHLIPFYCQSTRIDHVFQQDNASCHVSKSTKDWLNQRQVNIIEWPACSPDLNPIENLWGIIVRQIYADNTQYQSIVDLKQAIQRAWNNIHQETIDNLVSSMNNRLFQVINRNGGPTDY